MLAMMLAFIMVFAAAVPVFADNTDDSNAANDPPILYTEGDMLWMNFGVNYEKSIVRLSSKFIHANKFDTENQAS